MASDLFFKLEGITGEAQDDAHKEEIDVVAWNWGATQACTASDAEIGQSRCTIENLHFTKYIDKASLKLLKYLQANKTIPTAVLTCRKSGGELPIDYLIITFTNVYITSIAIGVTNSDDNLPTEDVIFAFQKYKAEYQEQSPGGGKMGGLIISEGNIDTNS